jgi:hypothetical protein
MIKANERNIRVLGLKEWASRHCLSPKSISVGSVVPAKRAMHRGESLELEIC